MSLNLAFAVSTGGEEAPASTTVTADVADSLLSLLETAGNEIGRDAEAARMVIRRACSILRVELERQHRSVDRDSNQGELAAWQVSRVRAYVEEHLSERIHVRDLSAVARRSTAHFCRSFKRTLGETPHHYVTRRRLDRAQRLMLTGDAPLSEIAILCGFSDQAHFCNRFRETTGHSPAAWRRERRENSGVVPLLQPNADPCDDRTGCVVR